MLSPIIINLIEKKLGKEICYPSDCESLQLDIINVTKQMIGVNTIKRLLGVIAAPHEPRPVTLDIIARYLDFKNWEELTNYTQNEGNSAFQSMEGIDIRELRPGQKVFFRYNPDREICLEHIERNQFRVIESRNSKLQENDVLEINHFVEHYPLVVVDVKRAGKSMGEFTAGKVSGITALQLI